MKKRKTDYFTIPKVDIAKNRGIRESVSHAIDGFIFTVFHERNMKVDLFFALAVLIFSLFLDLTKVEFALLSITIFFVLACETLNTAVENLCDFLVGTKYDSRIRIIKDVAAGACFLAAVNALVVGYMLFFDEFLQATGTVYEKVRKHPSNAAFIALAIVIILVVFLKVFLYRGHGTPLEGGTVSGHAAISFCLATMGAFLIPSTTNALICYMLAVLVCESRLERGIHSFGEVIAGAFLGTGVGLIIFTIFT